MKNRDEMDKRTSGEAERNMGKRGFEITTMATLGGAGEARCPERTRCCEQGTARERQQPSEGECLRTEKRRSAECLKGEDRDASQQVTWKPQRGRRRAVLVLASPASGIREQVIGKRAEKAGRLFSRHWHREGTCRGRRLRRAAVGGREAGDGHAVAERGVSLGSG